MLKNIIRLARIHQYIKNLFIFAPLFFSGKFVNLELLRITCLAFIAFSLVASSVYILNDLKDIKADLKHNKKKHRPIASGAISQTIAIFLMGIFLTAGVSLMAILSTKALIVLGCYVLLNITYSFYLKHIALLDIATIAVGFCLRLFVGSSVNMLLLSQWVVLMTFLLALFIALAKRRDDVLLFLNTGEKMRQTVDGYNLKFIDTTMAIMASVVLVTYILYTTSLPITIQFNTTDIYLTSIFVIFGILRYLQIVFVAENSGSPTKIVLKDRLLQCIILLWILSFAWIIYF